ncbi:MAG: hypothetical protein R6V32_02810 [Bacteroidales bacterium]
MFVFSACKQNPEKDLPEKNEFAHLEGYYEDSVYDSIREVYCHRRLVAFGLERAFILDSAYDEGVVDSNVYQRYFNHNDITDKQVPLNRYIKKDNEDLYIALCLDVTPKEMAEEYRDFDTAFVDMQCDDRLQVCAVLSDHDSLWSVRTIIDDNKTYMFSYLGRDSADITDKFNNYAEIKKKIISTR